MLTIALSRIKSLFAAPLTLALMLLVPVSGSLLASGITESAGQAIPVAVVDEDGTPYARQVITRLAQREVLDVTVTDRAEAIRGVERRRFEAALIIERGFQDGVRRDDLRGLVSVYRSPSSVSAEMAGEYLAAEALRLASNSLAATVVTKEYRRRELVAPEGTDQLWAEAWAFADGHWEPEPLMGMTYRELTPEGPTARPDRRASGLPLVWVVLASLVMFNALLAADWLIGDRERGVLPRVATTRTSLLRYLLGTGVAIALLGAVTMALGALCLRLAAGPPLPLGVPQAWLFAAYLWAVTGLAVLAGILLKSHLQLQALAPFLTFAGGVLGSGPVGLSDVSGRFALLGMLTPQGWLAAGFQEVAAGAPSAALLPPAAALLVTGLLCFLAGWRLSLRSG